MSVKTNEYHNNQFFVTELSGALTRESTVSLCGFTWGSKSVQITAMSSRKLKEEEARRLREEARKFLEVHQCGPRDPNAKVTSTARDNTFEQLREARKTSADVRPPAQADAQQTPAVLVTLVNQPSIPTGWRVDGSYFVHERTGCAVRSDDPKEVKGGMLGFRPLPKGWKLVKNPDRHDGEDAPFFYWNSLTNESTWSFPAVDEAHSFHPSTEQSLNKANEDKPVSNEQTSPTVKEESSADSASAILDSAPSSNGIQVQLQLKGPVTKRSKPSSLFSFE